MEYGLLAVWLLALVVLLRAGQPLVAALVPALEDRAAYLGLPAALAVLFLGGYWVGHLSLGLAPWVALALLLAGALALERRRGRAPTEPFLRALGLFLAGFLLLVAIRAVDPSAHPAGGEKFLDFGLLKALARTSQLPPEDMWFAGEPVSYYYGGHLIVSLLSRLTGVAPQYAYNLGLATFFGALVTAAGGLAGAIADARGQPTAGATALGALFVGLASNLSTLARLVVSVLPADWRGAIYAQVGHDPRSVARGIDQFFYWSASRIIDGTINEFPLFAWLNGDLHAHMSSTPFLLLVATVLFGYYHAPAGAVRRRRLLIVGALPPLAGLLAVTNTWSFPTVGGLTLLTLAMAPAEPRSLLPAAGERALESATVTGQELRRLALASGAAVAVLLGGVAWSLPFWLGTATGREVAVLPDRSLLLTLVLVHGAFLAIFWLHLGRHAGATLENPWAVGLATLVVAVVAWWLDAPAVGLFGPLIVFGWLLRRWRGLSDPPPAASTEAAPAPDGGVAGLDFETVLIVGGAGLAVLVEFVYVSEQAGPGRMNTVFKTYMQIWVLWGTAAGAALWALLQDRRPSLPLSGPRGHTALQVLTAFLLISTSLYAGFALTSHFTGDHHRLDDPSLDATAYVATAHPDEAAAIDWLDDREGQPTIATAPGRDLYSWTNAPSSLTGLPTVVGWVHHERGFGRATADARARDVDIIFAGSPADSAAMLETYDVEYIYVGPRERSRYGAIDLSRVPGVSHHRQIDGVTIYRVDQDALS